MRETMSIDTDIQKELHYPDIDLSSFTSKRTEEPLTSMVQTAQDVNLLLDMRTTNPSDEVLVEAEQRALAAAALCVTSCLDFEATSLPWIDSKNGNCYSYTWLIGETARSLGFTSLIAFSNDHAFNLVVSNTGQKHVINGESRHMWFFDTERNPVTSTTPALARPNYDADELVTYSRLDTTALRLFNDGYSHPSGGVRKRLPWLDDNLPAMALMNQDAGKHALYHYNTFVHALHVSDFSGADSALNGLMVVNPQAETRGKINNVLKIFGKQIKHWLCEGQETDDLVAIIYKYQQIMPDTKGMNIHIGNWLRSVGETRSDVEVLKIAKEHYEKAESLGDIKNDPMLNGKKMKVAEAILVASKSKN